ncbi:hypothetical protein PAHAL_1G138500 [Panicum hallii]|uniref:Secreted protein n=1 Tax=Panicum hallii TaxID=206008 RepID=A0A2T8KV56_9POAL|nr:hypothetical protein PAHAL_1G138500 [Panicum hallii]
MRLQIFLCSWWVGTRGLCGCFLGRQELHHRSKSWCVRHSRLPFHDVCKRFPKVQHDASCI